MNPFTSIPVKRPKLNKFKLDNTQYLSTGFGLLTPSLVLDAIPGDRHRIEMAHLIRTEPLVSPTYGKIDVIHDFYRVNYRNLTDRKSYDQFFTGGVSGDIKIDFPYLSYEDIFKCVLSFLRLLGADIEDIHNFLYLTLNFDENFSEQRNSYYYNELYKEIRYFFNLLDNLNYPILNTFDNIYSLPEPFLMFDIDAAPEKYLYSYSFEGSMYYVYIAPTYENYKFNAINLLSFIRIYYDNYIDQNLQPQLFDYLSVIFDSANFGKSFSEIFSELFSDIDLADSFFNGILYRSFRKNYYSSVLPNSQRGSQVTIPVGQISTLGSQINIKGTENNTKAVYTTNANGTLIGHEMLSGDTLEDAYSRSGNTFVAELLSSGELSPLAVTAIRTALKLQQWLEKNNIAGSRYFEHILAHFGIAPSDKSLQRSQYLGGTLSDLGISIVENTAMSEGSSALGELAGRGTSNNYIKLKSVDCDEHCIIMGICTIMPRPIYTQAVSRFIFKKDKFDLFYPEFQHIGEQEIPTDEIFFNGHPDNTTYGYQQRYGEYKFLKSGVHGSFRGSDSSYIVRFPTVGYYTEHSLNNNSLSIDKIQCRPGYFSYLFNYSGAQEQVFKCMFQFKIRSLRPISFYSMPQLS